MLSTNYRVELADICCRMMSTDGNVSLKERIWMHKLIENNIQARDFVASVICPDKLEGLG